MSNQRYLGDGVYAQWDGWGVWLLVNSHENPTDRVYLEPNVLERLNETMKAWQEAAARGDDEEAQP